MPRAGAPAGPGVYEASFGILSRHWGSQQPWCKLQQAVPRRHRVLETKSSRRTKLKPHNAEMAHSWRAQDVATSWGSLEASQGYSEAGASPLPTVTSSGPWHKGRVALFMFLLFLHFMAFYSESCPIFPQDDMGSRNASEVGQMELFPTVGQKIIRTWNS